MKRDLIKKLIDKNGEIYQSNIAMEECSELITAINKMLRYPNNHERFINLIEEIADVMICIEQLQEVYGITDEELFAMKQAKEKRLIEREGLCGLNLRDF